MELGVDKMESATGWPALSGHGVATLQLHAGVGLIFGISMHNGNNIGVGQVANTEPHNLIVPFFSKRKTVSYS